MINQFDEFKNIYRATGVPQTVIEESWTAVSRRLPVQDAPVTRRPFRFAYVFAGLILALLISSGGIVAGAQAAKPGDLLYPVKVTTERVVSELLKRPEIQIERRSEDVIQSIDDEPAQLDEAVLEYENALEDVTDGIRTKNSSDKKELKKTLQHQLEKMKTVPASNSHAQQKVEQIIEKTDQVHQDIQGASDSAIPDHAQNENREKENPGRGKNK